MLDQLIDCALVEHQPVVRRESPRISLTSWSHACETFDISGGCLQGSSLTGCAQLGMPSLTRSTIAKIERVFAAS